MSGKWHESSTRSMYVVTWSDGQVARAYKWDDWENIPVHKRPFNCTALRAKDELDAMLRAERGEEWHTQLKDQKEQGYDAD